MKNRQVVITVRGILLKHLLDHSDEKGFRFSIECGECKRRWTSRRYPFSKAHTAAPTREKEVVYSILYGREKKAAVVQAIKEAEFEFNLCPVCGKLVCNRCFCICEDLDMCSKCAALLKENGELVVG